MRTGKWGTVLALFTLSVVTALAQAPSAEADPQVLLDKVFAQYKSMATYADHGTIVDEVAMPIGTMHQEIAFSIKIKKPNQYLISWTEKTGSFGLHFFTHEGAVWSDGTQPYIYMGFANAYAKRKSDRGVLEEAAGISGRTTLTIPSLFLPSMKPVLLMHLKDRKIEGTESIGGEECYVLKGSSPSFPEVTFWISKSRFLVLQFRYSLKTPPGGIPVPSVTEEEVAQKLKDEGQPLTDENQKKARAALEKEMAMVKTVKLDGFSTETHSNITSPDLSMKDFQFTPPAGSVLKSAP